MLIHKNLLSLVYMAGLLLVALAVTGSYWLVDYQVGISRQADQVVRLGYQQSVLAERISQLSYRYIYSESAPFEAVQQKLNEAVDAMRQNHQQLLKSPGMAAFARAADAIYFDPQYALDQKLRTFLGAASELQQEPPLLKPRHPLARFLSGEQTDELHGLLELALERYQFMADKALSRTRSLLWGMYLFIMLVLLLESLLVFRLVFQKLIRRTEVLRDLAQTDPLTGCSNRRSFIQSAEKAQRQVNQGLAEHALLMLDIDHFKRVNDLHGHPMGDKVIRKLAQTCIRNLRSSDVLGRMGGEEFAILLSGNSLESAGQVAEQLRQKLEACQVMHDSEGKEPVHFTVSIGVTRLQPGDDSAMQAVERADAALYRAKGAGRNRVVVVDEPSASG